MSREGPGKTNLTNPCWAYDILRLVSPSWTRRKRDSTLEKLVRLVVNLRWVGSHSHLDLVCDLEKNRVT